MSKSSRQGSSSQEFIEKWKLHLYAWQNSSLSQAEYCRRENISERCFSYWKKKLAESPPSPGLTLIQLASPEPCLSSAMGYSASSSPSLRFWLKDFCIELSEDFSPPALTRLIETLRSV